VCGEKKKSGFNKKVLTDELKPCNIIQVVSEQHNVLQRRQQDIGSQDEKKEQKSS
jgi:adenylate kinase